MCIVRRRPSPTAFRQSVFSSTMSVKEREYFRKSFNVLKPACDAFITEPSTANAGRLKKVLATVPGCSLEQLQPYVLIPLEIHLQTTEYVRLRLYLFAVFILKQYLWILFRFNCTLDVLDVLAVLLKKTSVNLWSTFKRVYSLLVGKLADKNHPDECKNYTFRF